MEAYHPGVSRTKARGGRSKMLLLSRAKISNNHNPNHKLTHSTKQKARLSTTPLHIKHLTRPFLAPHPRIASEAIQAPAIPANSTHTCDPVDKPTQVKSREEQVRPAEVISRR